VGLVWSCLYLTLTALNYHQVHRTIEGSLHEQGINYKQFLITPTIFNNLLWNVVVDTEEAFLLAQHSILDEIPIAFHPTSKGYELLHHLDTDETLGVLRWFSDGYLNAVRRNDGSLQLNDLRFGTFSGRAKDADDYIFRFKLIDQGLEKPYGFERAQGGPPDEKAEDMMLELFNRACGRSLEDAAM
jgi:inner membrane protein